MHQILHSGIKIQQIHQIWAQNNPYIFNFNYQC